MRRVLGALVLGALVTGVPSAARAVPAFATAPATRLFADGTIGRASRGYAEFSVADGSLTGWNPISAFDGYAITVGPGGLLLVVGGEGGVDVFR